MAAHRLLAFPSSLLGVIAIPVAVVILVIIQLLLTAQVPALLAAFLVPHLTVIAIRV